MLLQSYTSNNHEIQFEEQVPKEDPVDEAADELEAFQANFTPPSRPRMDKATWDSISVESRKQWSMIKDADKAKILGYATKKATFGKSNGRPPVTRGPDGRFQPGRPSSGPRRAHQAEINSLFEDPIESEESNESTNLEAKVHESSFHDRTRFSKQTNPTEVHLQDITKQVIKSDPGNIAALLAQTKKVKLSDTKKTSHMLPADRAQLSYEARLHEQFTPRPDYVPESYNTEAPYSTDLQVSMANLFKNEEDTSFSDWVAQWAAENGGLVTTETLQGAPAPAPHAPDTSNAARAPAPAAQAPSS